MIPAISIDPELRPERPLPELCEEGLASLARAIRERHVVACATDGWELERTRTRATELLIDAALWLNQVAESNRASRPVLELLRAQFFRAMRRVLHPLTMRNELAHALQSAADVIGSIRQSVGIEPLLPSTARDASRYLSKRK